MHTESDITLLNSAREMNGETLVKIFDLYAPAIYNYALRIGRDPLSADHIVGDVFAKLLDKLYSGNGPTANLRSYLFEIAYHLIVDEVRYSQRRFPSKWLIHFEMMDVPHFRVWKTGSCLKRYRMPFGTI